jgi:hypothetical protein
MKKRNENKIKWDSKVESIKDRKYGSSRGSKSES